MTTNLHITVIDDANTPLLVMDAMEAHRQHLLHRGAGLMIRDRQHRLLLHRLPADHPRHPRCLDIAGCGHVPLASSVEETAERFLPEELQGASVQLVCLAEVPQGMGTGREIVTVFEAVLSPDMIMLLCRNSAYFFVDHDELAALTRNYPDQLTPDLLTLWQSGLIGGDRILSS